MDSSTLIDEGVINRAINGDKEAFAIIVRGSGARVLLVAERILKSPEEATSAAHSLFVTAFASLKKLRSKGFLETWLLQILVGVCGEKLKERGGKPGATSSSTSRDAGAGCAAEIAAPGASSTGQTADRLSHMRARNKKVKQAVDSLPFKERTAVMFRDWDGVSPIEIAEILRISREDVRKLIVNSRKVLADLLETSEGWACLVPRTEVDDRASSDEKRPPSKSKTRDKCGKKSDKLWLFVGGELGQTEQVDLLSHLERCPACRDSLARASFFVEAMREAAPVEEEPPIAPDKLWKEVEPLLAR